MRPLRVIDGFTSPESSAFKNKKESSQEDNLPFSLDDDSSGPDGSPTSVRRSALKPTYGFALKPEDTGFGPGNRRSSEEYLKEPLRSMNHKPVNISSSVVDSLEWIDEDYVLVSSPLGDASCFSASVSKLCQLASKPGTPLTYRNLHSTSSTPSRISRGSVDLVDASEHSSSDLMATIKSLQHFASAIAELVNKKIEAGQQLEAFSIQLVILAIWKQALHISQTQAASTIEGSPSEETMGLKDHQECLETAKSPQDVCFHIERIFLYEVENAEEFAKLIEPGNVGMPDAMEIIFQAALTFGKHGAVEECIGDVENATILYSKAVCLLSFLLFEAPSLILNPPFSITKSDSFRLRTYIDVLKNRQKHSRSQRMALLKH